MARGDVKNDVQTITNNSFLDIQPASTEEWLLLNVMHEGAIELHFYNGTISCIFATPSGAARERVDVHMTNTKRIRVKNTSGGDQEIAYSAVQTK